MAFILFFFLQTTIVDYFDYNIQKKSERIISDTLFINLEFEIFDFNENEFYGAGDFDVSNDEIIFYDSSNNGLFKFKRDNKFAITELTEGKGRGPKDILDIKSLDSSDSYYVYSDQNQQRVTILDKKHEIVYQEVTNTPVESLTILGNQLFFLQPINLKELIVLKTPGSSESDKIIESIAGDLKVESTSGALRDVIHVQLTGRLDVNDKALCHLGYWSGFLNCYDTSNFNRIFSKSVLNKSRFANAFRRVVNGGLAQGIERDEKPASLNFSLGNEHIFVIPAERVSKYHFIDIYDLSNGNYIKSLILSEPGYLIRSVSVENESIYIIVASDDQNYLKLLQYNLKV